MLLNGSHTTKSFLKQRQFYTTLQPSLPPVPVISIGPQLIDYTPSTTVGLFSGLSKAQISATEITCRNGKYISRGRVFLFLTSIIRYDSAYR